MQKAKQEKCCNVGYVTFTLSELTTTFTTTASTATATITTITTTTTTIAKCPVARRKNASKKLFHMRLDF